MFKALAFGLGVGAAIQAWRNWPATALVTADSLAFVFCLGLVAAYLGGRWSSRGSGGATAVAVASAEAASTSVASNNVNVAFVMPGHGAGSASSGVTVPTDSAPWIASSTRPQLTSNDLEGFDPDELRDLLPDGHHEV